MPGPSSAWPAATTRFRERCLGQLERRDEVSRVRARLAADGLLALAPRLRRRATLRVVHLPPALLADLEGDASLVRTGASAAVPYGWTELSQAQTQAESGRLGVGCVHLRRRPCSSCSTRCPPRLALTHGRSCCARSTACGRFPRTVSWHPSPWPPSTCSTIPRRHRGAVAARCCASSPSLQPTTVARRTARARTLHGPLLGKTLGAARSRGPRPVVEGDPLTDTRAAAAHIVGVLWATASQGATVKELRAAIGLTRERLEAAYTYLLENPPLGQSVQRQKDELFLVSAPEVSRSIERHLGHPRPVPLSRAATEVLAIVAYKQPITRAGVELTRGTSSESALDTLLVRGLVGFDQHHLLVTTRAFLDFAGLRDLADLPPLPDLAAEETAPDWAAVG